MLLLISSLALSDSRSAEEKATIVDEFFKRYEIEVAKRPEDHGMDYVHAYIVIAKNWETLTNPGWVGRHHEIQSLYHVTALGPSKPTFMWGHWNKL